MSVNSQHRYEIVEGTYIRGVIKLDIDEIATSRDYDEFLDLMSERLCGCYLLMDIGYKIVGFEPPDIILVEVEGDASEVFEVCGKEGG